MIIGLDVGLTGAIATLTDAGEFHDVMDLPTMHNGKKTARVKQQVNPAALADIVTGLQGEHSVFAFVESVASRPGQGVAGMFSLGQSFGVVTAVLAALKIPYSLISPTVWKRYFALLGVAKDAARSLAIERMPLAAPWLARKRDIGRADALLIALYGVSLQNPQRALTLDDRDPAMTEVIG